MKTECSAHTQAHILGFASYVPYCRIDIGTLADQWGLGEAQTKMYRFNGRNRMSVASADEDTVTLAIEAGRRLMQTLDKERLVQALMIGSESHPYAVKPSGVVVSEALGITPDVFNVDLEFACKGGTAAMMLAAALVQSGMAANVIAIGADCPQSAPGSLLEGSVGSGAAAMLLGNDAAAGLALITAVASASSDVTDFWRRDGAKYPSMIGKFSVDEGYMAMSARVVESLLDVSGSSPGDFDHVIFHQPYSSLPAALAKRLGFRPAQLRAGLASSRIGNTYSASTMLSLCAVLEVAKAGDRIMVVSFGSGAGSDGFVLEAGPALEAYRALRRDADIPTLASELSNDHCSQLSYGTFARLQGKLQ